jgi:hypothetical protein
MTHLFAAYNQQRQYFKERGNRQCAREIFRSHLLKVMHKWRENGERLILLVDGNEDLPKHHLGNSLRAELNMIDLVEERTGVSGPATFCRGSEKNDGAFATRDIECTGARFVPLRDGRGDHRSIILDFAYCSLIGKEKLVVERPQARRLQFAITSSVKAYNHILTKRFKECNFYKKVCTIYSKVTFPISPKVQNRAEKMDALRIDCMRAAEKGCRIFRTWEVEYSLEVSTWGTIIYIWRTVLKWHDNSKSTKLKRRNFRKKAKACSIFEPFSPTRSQVCRNFIS